MGTIIYLSEYFKTERKINVILSSSLISRGDEPLSNDCHEEAREIIKLYLIDKTSFKDKAATYLKFFLELESNEIGNTLNQIVKVIEK